MAKENVAIVGSGFLGMMLALLLAQRGAGVTLFESAGEIGAARLLADEGVDIRLNSPVQRVEKIGNHKLRVTLRHARRRTDAKPEQRTKYATVKASLTVPQGFSGAFLTEPELKTNGVIEFPRNGLTDTFDKVILTCPSKAAATIAPQLTLQEKLGLENISRGLHESKTSVDGLYLVNSSHIEDQMSDVNATTRLAERFISDNFIGTGR